MMQVWKLLSLSCIFGLMVWGCEKQPVGKPKPVETPTPVEAPKPIETAEPVKQIKKLPPQKTTEPPRYPRTPVVLQWFGHASFKIYLNGTNIYIDPWKLKVEPHNATIVLISHNHRDHCSVADIAKVSGPDTKIFATLDVIEETGWGREIKPGETIELDGVKIVAVAAYNSDTGFHPKDKNWLGFIIEISGKRIYYAGDTDIIDEMQSLGPIDLALLPVGGTYTMNGMEAAQAVKIIKPKVAIPYHFGDVVGTLEDAVQFAENAECGVRVMVPGDKFVL
ncbi:MBL fold metallo-hydrolase [Planctomycetota bacterium]